MKTVPSWLALIAGFSLSLLVPVRLWLQQFYAGSATACRVRRAVESWQFPRRLSP